MPPVSESDYWRALFRPGARWQHLKTKRVVTVSSVDGKLVKMAGGEEVQAQRLLSRYRPMQEESKPGPTLRQMLRRAEYRVARLGERGRERYQRADARAKEVAAVRKEKQHRLQVVPIELREANAFVAQHHRHHKPVTGHRFSLGAVLHDEIVGVAIVGRPVSRHIQADGVTLEVNRLATNGTRNACSFLYAAAWKATQALGYKRLITYTLPEEGGPR